MASRRSRFPNRNAYCTAVGALFPPNGFRLASGTRGRRASNCASGMLLPPVSMLLALPLARGKPIFIPGLAAQWSNPSLPFGCSFDRRCSIRWMWRTYSTSQIAHKHTLKTRCACISSSESTNQAIDVPSLKVKPKTQRQINHPTHPPDDPFVRSFVCHFVNSCRFFHAVVTFFFCLLYAFLPPTSSLSSGLGRSLHLQ